MRGLPTIRQGAENAVLIAFVGWRVVVLAQMLAAVAGGFAASPRPAWYLAAVLVVVIESVVACLVGVRLRRVIGVRWMCAEVVGICALIVADPLLISAKDLVGSWIGFAPAVALCVVSLTGAALTGTARFGWLRAGAAVVLVTGCYLASRLPHVPGSLVPTVIGNALTYPTCCIVVALIVGQLRRWAHEAPDARGAATDAAAPAERRPNQLLLHDSASSPHRRGPTTLATAVCRATDGFGDLPIEFVLDLGGSTPLAPRCAETVRSAVQALLHNVRQHASATSVVIHADADASTGEWELSIRDNGTGFDPASTRQGFGLAVQVHRALSEQGVGAEIHSAPGEGTVAVLRRDATDRRHITRT